ncbi:CAP domain-containing protein [Actinoplanes sp. LDG1-06]|uniref:CAP domain-containing protein n=1 Tax=Paractinoplanes ovalisporus TaxID=2810368 RepID=A0ABS2AK51_9ACTN|nr:CAP domain-containing protein [Actinoplanes ovalisporus]MBM2620191.1 CAP domain-containing protein [Actinoplanes ovalisporus]
MRKPLVVVCAAASALLLAGGVAATSASADERPGWSDFFWPSLFGSDSSPDGFPGGSRDTAADPFADRGAPERPTLDDPAADDSDDAGSASRPNRARPDGDAAPDAPDADDAAGADGASGADDAPGGDAASGADAASDADAASGADADSGTDTRGSGGRSRQQADAHRQAARPHGAAQQPGFSAQRQPAANSGVMAGARQAVTSRDVSASPGAPVQQRVLGLINQNRRRGGCHSLTLDRRLIEAANDHAADMARRDYFDHQSPNGDSAGDRVSEAGYRWKRYGENIARGADSAYEVVNGWMNSPTHRRNILDCRLHQMGIGLAISGDRTPYWVQDFATPDA